ncbi:MAG: hypothetical protein GF363_07920 [Chitinivibrionales bacterium]|nr:hypothetical protein [Chitinivibrionales bacterium]
MVGCENAPPEVTQGLSDADKNFGGDTFSAVPRYTAIVVKSLNAPATRNRNALDNEHSLSVTDLG